MLFLTLAAIVISSPPSLTQEKEQTKGKVAQGISLSEVPIATFRPKEVLPLPEKEIDVFLAGLKKSGAIPAKKTMIGPPITLSLTNLELYSAPGADSWYFHLGIGLLEPASFSTFGAVMGGSASLHSSVLVQFAVAPTVPMVVIESAVMLLPRSTSFTVYRQDRVAGSGTLVETPVANQALAQSTGANPTSQVLCVLTRPPGAETMRSWGGSLIVRCDDPSVAYHYAHTTVRAVTGF